MNDEKDMLTDRYSTIVRIQKPPITSSSENLLDSQSSAYRRKYYHLFKKKLFKVLIFEKIRITKSIFLVNIWNHGKNFKICTDWLV